MQNRQGFFEDNKPRVYPVDSKLALHLIDFLMDNGFDPASSKRMRESPAKSGDQYRRSRSPDDVTVRL